MQSYLHLPNSRESGRLNSHHGGISLDWLTRQKLQSIQKRNVTWSKGQTGLIKSALPQWDPSFPRVTRLADRRRQSRIAMVVWTAPTQGVCVEGNKLGEWLAVQTLPKLQPVQKFCQRLGWRHKRCVLLSLESTGYSATVDLWSEAFFLGRMLGQNQQEEV